MAIYLHPPGLDAPAPRPDVPAPVTGAALELAFWQSIQGSRDAADFEAYLRQYPQGSFAELARNRVAALRVPEMPPSAASDSSPRLAQFRVEVTPSTARVRIMNIIPEYRDNMELEPGRYDIEVSAPGYQTHRSWYQLNAGPQLLRLTLERQAPSASVASASSPGAAAGTAAPAASGAGLIADRYQVRGRNGDIIYDTTTQLEWQRCSLGQTWDGRTCTGEASTHTWDNARSAADRVSGWLLPTIEELRTLVYCSSGQPAYFKNSSAPCSGDYQRPTIVAEAFPNTATSWFWSASPYAGGSAYAWVVNFGLGLDDWNGRSLNGRVRLVRGGQ